MPNYRLEDNPPSIYPAGSDIADLVAAAPTWWLVATAHNREKKTAWHFLEAGIPYFLPMVERKDDWRRRNLFPLFPGYLFAAPQPGRDIRSPLERGTWQSLFIADIVHEDWILVEELAALQEGIDNRTIKALCDLEPGDSCRITKGPFRDLEGEIERIDNRHGFAFLRGLMKNSETKVPIDYLEAV